MFFFFFAAVEVGRELTVKVRLRRHSDELPRPLLALGHFARLQLSELADLILMRPADQEMFFWCFLVTSVGSLHHV